MAKRNSKGPGLVIGTLVGAMIGATGALLLAPKRGEEVRKDLVERLNITPTENKPLSHMILEMGSEWEYDFFEDDENQTSSVQEDQGGGDVGYVVNDMLDNMEEQRG
ncbi:hypothetical protein BTR23_04245 [Alkalihalophilus pseudofirmus]|nr:hypothetical protein BTR23_04245 [Alkalihalophilus pseudofirmus]